MNVDVRWWPCCGSTGTTSASTVYLPSCLSVYMFSVCYRLVTYWRITLPTMDTYVTVQAALMLPLLVYRCDSAVGISDRVVKLKLRRRWLMMNVGDLYFDWFMVALCNRTDHIYFHPVICSFFFFSSPNASGRRLDVCHTSTHGVALVWI